MPGIVHGECHRCGETTCFKRIIIDPDTRRRRYVPSCIACDFASESPSQKRLKRERTEYDWTRPIPDQYAGLTRSTLREFIESNQEDLVLGDCLDPGLLNASIFTLGFADEVYAEQRDGGTVIRRVTKETSC